MRLSWKLGQVAGIDLFLHPSALLLFLIGASMMPTGLESAALIVGLLGSIVLHELGHALMARWYGIQTADITLYLIGGVARLERMPRSSGPELLIALAGPAVNFAIVAVLGAFLAVTHALGLYDILLVVALLQLNLFLGLFNLLPVFPMDGGRVFRALLSGWVGRLRATEVAVLVGRALALAGAIYCLSMGDLKSLILVGFVFVAGTMELQQVRDEGQASLVPADSSTSPTLPPASAGQTEGTASGGSYRSWSTRQADEAGHGVNADRRAGRGRSVFDPGRPLWPARLATARRDRERGLGA